MAGFFSLGSGSASGRETTTTPQQDQTNADSHHHHNNPNWAANPAHPGLLLYRNEEVYQKGFEIWQQYVQVHHHHHHPKLLHQDHHHPFLHPALYMGGGDQLAGPSSGGGARSSSSGSRVMMRGGGSGGGGAAGGGINCQDCGNQAKKDCSHMRCRTCCKSRGFDCATHVKSTWVPAAKRRERQQQQIMGLQQQQQQQQQELEIGMREKRQRESRSLANADANITTTSTNNNNPLASRMGASSSGLEVGQHFPPELSSPAVFRCVRVHSVDNADEQLAYQTAVNIGGHLFKGILYDQGPDSTHYPPAAGDSSSGGEPSGAATLHHHHSLLTSAPTDNPGAATCVDPNAIYPPPISAFLAGTQFFPPPRS